MELQKTIRASVGIDRVKSMQGAEKLVCGLMHMGRHFDVRLRL